MNRKTYYQIILIVLFFAVLLFPQFAIAVSAGKIAGKVFDVETNEPLAGANIIIDGTLEILMTTI